MAKREVTIKDISAPENLKLGDLIYAIEAEKTGDRIEEIGKTLGLRLNQYNDISLTTDDFKRLKQIFRDIEVGTATSLIMRCKKEKCVYLDRCPLYVADKFPIGKECLIENKILAHTMSKYIDALNIDSNNFPELSMVNKLAEIELLEHRCNCILAFDHTNLKMESVVGLDVEGNIVTKEDISYALQIKQMVSKEKTKIFESFTATREQEYKKQAALKIPTATFANTLSKMKKQVAETETIVDLNELAPVNNGANPLIDDDI